MPKRHGEDEKIYKEIHGIKESPRGLYLGIIMELPCQALFQGFSRLMG